MLKRGKVSLWFPSWISSPLHIIGLNCTLDQITKREGFLDNGGLGFRVVFLFPFSVSIIQGEPVFDYFLYFGGWCSEKNVNLKRGGRFVWGQFGRERILQCHTFISPMTSFFLSQGVQGFKNVPNILQIYESISGLKVNLSNCNLVNKISWLYLSVRGSKFSAFLWPTLGFLSEILVLSGSGSWAHC